MFHFGTHIAHHFTGKCWHLGALWVIGEVFGQGSISFVWSFYGR